MRVDSGGHINGYGSGAMGVAQEMARLSLEVSKKSGGRITPTLMDLSNKIISGSADPATVDSYIRSMEPQLDRFRDDWQLDHILSLPNFNGDHKQFMYPDPVKNKPAESGNSKFMRQMEERTGGSTLGDQAARADAAARAAQTFVPPPSTGNVLADRDAWNKAAAEHLATVNASSDLHPGQMNDRQAEFLKMAVKALSNNDPVAKAATMKTLEQMTKPDSTV